MVNTHEKSCKTADLGVSYLAESIKRGAHMTFVERIKRLTFKKVLRKTKWFVKKNVVMFVALIAAAITCIFVPFDREYLSYFKFRKSSIAFLSATMV